METTKYIESILNEVQKKIYAQRTEALTPIEINKLFKLPVTPEFNLIIYRGLQRGALNPDIAILQAIPRAQTKDYLISIALCLRFGADANMYVDAPKLGTVHILGYVYDILGTMIGNEDILNTIVLMLIIKGSRPSMPMFDRNAGKIQVERKASYSSSSPSVIEWLNSQGYNTILDRIHVGDVSELHRIVDKNSLAILSILLDMPIITDRQYEPPDMLLAIRTFSNIVFDDIPLPTGKVMMDFKSLDDAVTYLNSNAYQKLLSKGQMPSYILINKILINMREYRNANQTIALQELENMLLSSISLGSELDRDQLSIISTMGQDILEAVMKEYEQPYWRKICKSSNHNIEIPESLRRLAISLNIDPSLSQTTICDKITTLSKADKEALKEAARRRQQLRMNSELGHVNDFLHDKIPNLVCRNKALLPQDPLDYNDLDLAYYRDEQGAVWCFGSDSFSSLLEDRVNPYNSTILPPYFIEELRYRIDALRRLGIYADEVGIYASKIPITFSSALDDLNIKDTIGEKSSEQALNIFIRLASRSNISANTIRSLTKETMMQALNSIGYNVNLIPLSTSHALITTARVIDYINRIDPDLVIVFFNSLKMGRSS